MIPTIPATGDPTADPPTGTAVINLKKGDSAGMLGNWKGTDYAGMTGTGDAKTTGMVRAYSNEEMAKSVRFDNEDGRDIHLLPQATTSTNGDYVPAPATDSATAATAVDATTTDPPVSTNIVGFPGTGTHDYDETETVTGSYMGASGTYKCVSTTCTSNAEGTAGVDLSTGWTFTPLGGATLQDKDDHYLRFGWWIRKDKDGPTHAGTFYNVKTTATGGITAVTEAVINTDALIGEAKYTGAAAGKFAISDRLTPSNDNAGHFTADAELTADFKAAGSTLSGTIDNFRLNDGSVDPGWSIELQKTMFSNDDDKFMTNATPSGDQTVWSIGEGKGAASGSWEAQMYNDKKSDDSNVPQSVVGSFTSSISTTHSMNGAFGAEKQQ